MLIHYFYPERLVDEDDVGAAAQVKSHAQAKIGAMLEQIDAQLAEHGDPWLLGEHYSAVDPYAFMLCRWTRAFDTRPARDYAHIAPFLKRVAERSAVQRVFAAEGLTAPWY
jgi:glutathione S-transferase